MISLPNVQPIERVIKSTGDGTLDVVSIFRTIQGEGMFVGRPAVFVRTAGCNLRCQSCDTDYTSNRRKYTADSVVKAVKLCTEGRNIDLVVLTGGEPFRQPIGLLTDMLVDETYEVQIETNGTIFRPDFNYDLCGECVCITCSPKTDKVHDDLVPHIGSLKYVIDHEHVDPTDGLPTSVLGQELRPWRPDIIGMKPIIDIKGIAWSPSCVYLQPCDSQNEDTNLKNVRAAVDSCIKHGYVLSLQTHKIVGLP